MSVNSWQNPDFRKDTGMDRYYRLAKHAEWHIDEVPFGQLPPIPERTTGTPTSRAARRDMWRSVVFRQLHADMRAMEMANHLFRQAEHEDALAYYNTMVDDETRHTEAWLRLAKEAGGDMEVNPYLENLCDMVMSADLPTASFMMQGVFEKGIIPKFKEIAIGAKGTVLEDMCKRLAIDDGIHHASGVNYLKTLLEDLSPERKLKIAREAAKALPAFINFATWRPKAMGRLGNRMHDNDMNWIQKEVQSGAKLGQELGLPFHRVDFSDLPDGITIRLRETKERAA